MVETPTEASKYDAIVEFLRSNGPRSTSQVAKSLAFNGNGQALTRLRLLEQRGRVKSYAGPRGRLWQTVE